MRSRKAPTSQHPYGYLKDKFVWSLVSAVGIFCLGAGITTAHGFSSLMAPPQALENLGYGLTGGYLNEPSIQLVGPADLAAPVLGRLLLSTEGFSSNSIAPSDSSGGSLHLRRHSVS